MKRRTEVGRFDSVFDFGGRRLAMNSAGDRCVAAAWSKGARGGVACYEVPSGRVLWHRTDIRHVQSVRFSHTGDSVWCGADEGRLQHLSVRTGETLDALAGLKDMRDGAVPGQVLLVTRSRGFRVRACTDFHIAPLTFALLDAAFSDDAICISEACGPVRCFALPAKRERWRFEPPRGCHVVTLWFRPADRQFYGVLIGYQTGAPNLVVRFDAETGHSSPLCELSHWAGEPYDAGDGFLTTAGEIVDVGAGVLAARLNFSPECDPDGENLSHGSG